MSEQNEAKSFTMPQAQFEKLLKLSEQRGWSKGFEEGKASVKSLYIGEHLGSVDYVTVMHAPSKRGLVRKVREEYPGHIDTGCGHDCSGRVCGRYGTILRTYYRNGEWSAVVHVLIAYDV